MRIFAKAFSAEAATGSAQKTRQLPKTGALLRIAKCSSVVSGLLTGAFIALPALAQPEVCLQLNRVYNTKVVDSQTLYATDLQHRPYLIHMTNRCVGLNEASENLSFRRANGIGTEYTCLKRGDILGYSFPGDPSMGLRSIRPHGVQTQMQCTIDSVTPTAPPPP